MSANERPLPAGVRCGRVPVPHRTDFANVTRKKAEPKTADDETPSFEKALAELEVLVETLEEGDLTLEESLKSFERGVRLARACQESLARAEQKVAMLSSADPDAELVPFGSD